jgi:hypothetical protein
MPTILDVHHESLLYTAKFEKPPFALWGRGGNIVGGFYDALAPYNVKLRQIQVNGSVPTSADPIITITLGNTVLKFSFEMLSVAFNGFNESGLRDIPNFLAACTGWLQKDHPFSSHEAFYFSHCFLKGVATDDFLRTISPDHFKSGGIDMGSGAVFYRAVPEKLWTTKLTIDKSEHFPGAVFLGLKIDVGSPTLDYDSLLLDGQAYFAKLLDDFGLALPVPAI